MERIAKALAQHDEAYGDVMALLFGDGAHELERVMKAAPMTEAQRKAKNERTQARVGLASNIVGLAAGAAGTKEAYGDFKEKRAVKTGAMLKPKPFKVGRKTKALAGAALGLQVANVAGDAIANRVLARSAADPSKKKTQVGKGYIQKMDPGPSDVGSFNPRAKLKRIAAAEAKKGAPKLKKIAEQQMETGKEKLKKNDLDVTWEGSFSKVDEDKRQVFGYASIVKVDGKDVVDRQGDHISIEEIEKSAYDYVRNSRVGGDMHLREGDIAKHGSDMIESFLITDEKVAKMGLPESTPRGWWVGFQVNDEGLWGEVKKGNRSGFSIHGKGVRKSLVVED